MSSHGEYYRRVLWSHSIVEDKINITTGLQLYPYNNTPAPIDDQHTAAGHTDNSSSSTTAPVTTYFGWFHQNAAVMWGVYDSGVTMLDVCHTLHPGGVWGPAPYPPGRRKVFWMLPIE